MMELDRLRVIRRLKLDKTADGRFEIFSIGPGQTRDMTKIECGAVNNVPGTCTSELCRTVLHLSLSDCAIDALASTDSHLKWATFCVTIAPIIMPPEASNVFR